MKCSKVDFSDFLNYFDFSYQVNENKTFSLIDLQYANLNNIENFCFSLDKQGILSCVNKLYVYINDYILRFLNENTELRFNTVNEALSFAKLSKNNEDKIRYWCDVDILNASANPTYIDINKLIKFNSPSNPLYK